jgi:hypothetical protein
MMMRVISGKQVQPPVAVIVIMHVLTHGVPQLQMLITDKATTDSA